MPKPRPAPTPLPDEGSADDADDRPSKTQRKQASHDLQALGVALAEMPDGRFDALELPETLRDAVEQYKRTRSHEGRRRQMQYVGKLMRLTDPEPIRAAVTAMQLGHARDALALHEAERWRTELIDSDDALTRWTTSHPDADVQPLRTLIRSARKDAALVPEQRSGRAYRELFRFIRREMGDA